MPITGAALDWQRADQWTVDILAGDMTAIEAVFIENGAQPPSLAWNPSAGQAGAPAMRFLMDYWRDNAPAGTLPHLKQIDPAELRPALGYLMLLDAVDGGRDYRYRLYGSIVASVSGFDMTGKLLSEHPASAYVTEFAIASYRAALRRRAPVYTERSPVGAVQAIRWQRIALPLVDDSGAAVRFLAGTAPINRDGQALRTAF
jgi:hypothetical protein